MIVDVRRLVVLLTLLSLASILVGVHDRRVVVLVAVVVAPMLELTPKPARVMMRDVVVIVRVHRRWVRVFVFDVAFDVLHRVLHGCTSQFRHDARPAAEKQTLRLPA